MTIEESEKALLAQVEAMMQAKLQKKIEQQAQKPGTERAELFPWWDVYAIGPFQTLAPFPGPVVPHQVIKLGQSATLITVVYLNPFTIVVNPPPTTARDFLTSFGTIPYSVKVSTGNKQTWTLAAGAGLQATQAGVLAPFGTTFFFNAFTFTPTTVGLHEMSVTGRIGAIGSVAPFGGYANWIIDPDSDFLLPPIPSVRYDTPVIFDVYA
jgi:hypothetical protein